jgi:hypothetical protein
MRTNNKMMRLIKVKRRGEGGLNHRGTERAEEREDLKTDPAVETEREERKNIGQTTTKGGGKTHTPRENGMKEMSQMTQNRTKNLLK